MIDLRPDLLAMVHEILARYVPEAEVWAFGSRTTGTAKKHSDLDLVVRAATKLPQKEYYRLQENVKKQYEIIFASSEIEGLC